MDTDTDSSLHFIVSSAYLRGLMAVYGGYDSPPSVDSMKTGEFSWVWEMMSSGRGAQLFSASFGSVPSVDRLTDWVATKWAPAVTKTYDIAGFRVSERPVFLTADSIDKSSHCILTFSPLSIIHC